MATKTTNNPNRIRAMSDDELLAHTRAALADSAAHGVKIDWPAVALIKLEHSQTHRRRTKALLALAIAFLFVGLMVLLVALAQAQDVTTAADVQDGTVDVSPCDTTNLPANVWTLVLYDNAGNPCTTHASQLTGTCNPDSTWNWMVDGHLTFTTAPGRSRIRVRVQVWAGGGGGSCHGGTSDPVVCDNQTFKTLKQDETYAVDSDAQGTALAVPINILSYLLAPYFETPSDANYQGIWIYVMPIGRPAVCRSMSYHDLAAN
jgi:hypothetical protein